MPIMPPSDRDAREGLCLYDAVVSDGRPIISDGLMLDRSRPMNVTGLRRRCPTVRDQRYGIFFPASSHPYSKPERWRCLMNLQSRAAAC